MTAYEAWVQQLIRDHRHRQQGHGLRYSGCWACDVLVVSEEDRVRCRELSGGVVDGDHLVQQQTLRRGPFRPDGPRRGGLRVAPTRKAALEMYERDPREGVVVAVESVVHDPRVGVPMRRYHHDQRHARRLEVPRALLPVELEEFCEELGLEWYLTRVYGSRV